MIEVLRLYPEFIDQFKDDILHDLTFNLREGYEAEEESSNEGSVVPLKSISEETDDIKSEHSSKSVHSNNPVDHRKQSEIIKDMTYLSTEMKFVMDKLERLSSGVKPLSPRIETHDKSVQTDFPASMLEEYVIKNRKRILRLLGMSSEVTNSSSWNPLPPSSPSSGPTTISPQHSKNDSSSMSRYNSTPVRIHPRARVKLLPQQRTLPSISLSLATPEDERKAVPGEEAPRDEELNEYAEYIQRLKQEGSNNHMMRKRHSTGSAGPTSFDDWRKIKKKEITRLDQGSTASLDDKPFVTDF